ncbi:helix-turn-helix domain-containing protein [Hyphomicrobium sp. CS1BSMeth3]|uniref:helix-turn-helix domain-containing protein n=1 Tax=Hyphomicrobium sp. CS1BSMeth3 TaxID=1892844 RepID=UPI0009306389|nr:helix-turn-helix domain-containing protein [Hyphomicrobium sp. CS1BSMeth3]
MPALPSAPNPARPTSPAACERFAYPINDACYALGIKRSLAYELIKRGELKAIKIAGRTLIPRSEIERLTRVDRDEAA